MPNRGFHQVRKWRGVTRAQISKCQLAILRLIRRSDKMQIGLRLFTDEERATMQAANVVVVAKLDAKTFV